MEFLGIGPSELVFIILIAIIILGPKDMQKAGRSIGRFLNQLVKSDSWKVFQKTSTEIRNLPRNLMREANMEEVKKGIQEAGAKLQDMDKEIRQTIDPRPQPPASPAVEPAPNLPASNEGQSLAQPEPTTKDDTNKND